MSKAPTLILAPDGAIIRIFTDPPYLAVRQERFGSGVLLRITFGDGSDGAETYISDENITQLIHALTESR